MTARCVEALVLSRVCLAVLGSRALFFPLHVLEQNLSARLTDLRRLDSCSAIQLSVQVYLMTPPRLLKPVMTVGLLRLQ